MFQNIKKRIYNSVMLLSLTLILLMLTCTNFILFSTLYANYEDIAMKKLERRVSACRNFVNDVLITANDVASAQDTVEAASGLDDANLTATLDAAVGFSTGADGITVYTLNGSVFSSSSVLNVPLLSDLRQNVRLSEFFDDTDATEYVSLRTEYVPDLSGGYSETCSRGIVSCCAKIYGENGVTGYVFADILPETVFRYFNYSNDGRFNESDAVVRFSGGYLASDVSSRYNDEINNTHSNRALSGDWSRMLLQSSRNYFGAQVSVSVPLSYYYLTMFHVLITQLAVSAILLVIIHFIARKQARSLTDRLNGLYEHIEEGEAQLKAQRVKD